MNCNKLSLNINNISYDLSQHLLHTEGTSSCTEKIINDENESFHNMPSSPMEYQIAFTSSRLKIDEKGSSKLINLSEHSDSGSDVLVLDRQNRLSSISSNDINNSPKNLSESFLKSGINYDTTSEGSKCFSKIDITNRKTLEKYFSNCAFTSIAPVIGINAHVFQRELLLLLKEFKLNCPSNLSQLSSEEIFAAVAKENHDKFQIHLNVRDQIDEKNLLTLHGMKLILQAKYPRATLKIHSLKIDINSNLDDVLHDFQLLTQNNSSFICHLGPHILYGQKINQKLEFIDFQLDIPQYNTKGFPKVNSFPSYFDLKYERYISFKELLDDLCLYNEDQKGEIRLLSSNILNQETLKRVDFLRK